MPLFHHEFTLASLDFDRPGTLASHLGMRCVEIGEDYLRMSMPVDHRTRQPIGLLHGGASVALGETIGGIASWAVLGPDSEFTAVGLEINANHVRGVRNGEVFATCRSLHLGRTTHVWDIRVETPEGKLVSVIRLTNAIIRKPG